jgi:hypothetical protein
MNKTGDIFVSDWMNHRISVHSWDGLFQRVLNFEYSADDAEIHGLPPSKPLRFPKGSALSPDESILAVTSDKHCIHLIPLLDRDTTHALTPNAPRWPWTIGGYGQDQAQFKNPHDCAFTADGSQLVVSDTLNHRVQLIGLDGKFVCYVGNGVGTGDGQLKYPRGVHVDPTGNIIVADDTRVQIFNGKGCFERVLLRMNNQAGVAGIHVHPVNCSIAVAACGEHRAVVL